MIDTLIEVRRGYGMEETKLMSITRQPSLVQMMIDQKHENVEQFKY
jgi:hypothetical protein